MPNGDGDNNEATFGGTFVANFGGDAPGTFSLAGMNGTSGLVGTETVNYSYTGNVLTATGPRGVLFTVSVNPTSGAYVVTLVDNVIHAAGGAENDASAILTFTATDNDGDATPGTLTITFDDDAPTAANDTIGPVAENQSVTFGVFGNDMFGADGVDTDNNPTVAVTFTQPPAGQGTISYNPVTAQFTFTPAAGQEGSTSFTYTITDGDGDPSTATVTINLSPDSVPIVTNAVASVDDDGLAGGNPLSTSGDLAVPNGDGDNNEATFGGTFVANFGGDAPGTFSLAGMNGTSGLVGTETVNYSYTGNVLTATGPRGVLFTVSVNPTSGAYVVTLVDNVIHAAGGAENDASAILTFTATDNDGDATPGTLTITFDDDAPTVTGNAIQPIIAVDETVLATNVSADFSGVFSVSPGADGLLTPLVPANYTLGINAGATGVFDTATGLQVVLAVVGTTVVGTAGAGGATVFVISVNASGTVTLDQQRAVIHNDPADPDEPGASSVMLLADNLITLTATVTDGDNDTAASTVNIGQNFQFEDDAGTLGAFTNATLPNAPNAHGVGTFAYSQGADGHGSFAITGPVLTGITYSTAQNASGALLTATADPDGPGGAAPVTVFTLQVNSNGTYDFTLVTPQASSTETVSLLNLSAGGPTPFVQTADGRIEFTGSGNGVNSSTQGFGVNNQFVGNGKSFTIEFHENGAPGNQPATTDLDLVTSAVLRNDNINGSAGFRITVFNDVDGTSEVVYANLTVTGTTTLIDPVVLTEFNRVLVEGISGSGQGVRFVSLDVSRAILPSDVNLHFDVTATDRDGDPTATSGVNIFIDASPPVVLDTNHDGSISSRRSMPASATTMTATAHAEGTAWVGAGRLDPGPRCRRQWHGHRRERVRVRRQRRDRPEALHAQYGEQLDASDADFVQFMAWNDANSNGIADAGEVHEPDRSRDRQHQPGVRRHRVERGGRRRVRSPGRGSFTYVNDNGDDGRAACWPTWPSAPSSARSSQAQRFRAAANNAALVDRGGRGDGAGCDARQRRAATTLATRGPTLRRTARAWPARSADDAPPSRRRARHVIRCSARERRADRSSDADSAANHAPAPSTRR